MDSYAYKQATMFQQMADKCARLWRKAREQADVALKATDTLDENDAAVPEPLEELEPVRQDTDDALGDEVDETVDIWDLEAEEDT